MKAYHVLVFIAHPDDERRISGTIVHFTRMGYSVCIVCLTHGEQGTYGTRKIRTDEMLAAAQVLGADLEFMMIRDTSVSDHRKSRTAVAKIIRMFKPELVLAPHPESSGIHGVHAHPDHRGTGMLVTSAVTVAAFKKTHAQSDPHRVRHIMYYMLPPQVSPNIYIAISDDEMRIVLEAAAKHASQEKAYKGRKPYPDFLVGLREWSHCDVGVQLPEGCVLTEQFLCVPSPALRCDQLQALLPDSFEKRS